METLIQLPKGICQLYVGTTCEPFLKNQTVFVPPHLSLESLEDNLKVAYYGVIKESKDMNPNCRGYALPSLCYSVLPICRTPEKTNHQYFRNIALQKEKERLRLAAAALATTSTTSTTTTTTTMTTTMATTTTTSKPTTTTTIEAAPANTSILDTTTIASTKATTQIIKGISDSDHTTTQEKNSILTEHMTTVKPRLKKSQKTRDKKTKKHSTHQNVGDHFTHTPPKDNEHWDLDEKSKRNRRFLSYFWDEHVQFQNVAEKFRHLRQALPISHSMIYSPDSNYPPARSTSNLRRICRNECELLENELCQKEYAIAKRHPAIGQVLPIEDCHNLPEEINDCSSLGIAIDVDENEDCYWENGSKYRGKAAVSKSGKPCLTWVRLMKEIADYPELAGTNFCRYVSIYIFALDTY